MDGAGAGMMQQQMQPEQMPGGGQTMEGAPQGQPGATPQGGPAAFQGQPNPEQGTYGADQGTPEEEAQENYINFALTQANLAKGLSKKKAGQDILKAMGVEIVERVVEDMSSRQPWLEKTEEWIKLATLVRDVRVYPWPKASNIKYPLLATAAMQFSARAYPALVPSDGHIVKTKIIQKDETDQLYKAAERISQHMSYQILERIPNWEEDMDKLLMTMAITGICFKKTYYDAVEGCIKSPLISPEKLIINYHAKNLAKAYRKTEWLEYNDNELAAKVRNDEEFLDLDFSAPTNEEKEQKKPVVSGVTPPPAGKSTPHIFLACHTYWDLDDDGYEEPYIIVVHKATKQVVRIIARWCLDGVHRNAKDKISRIEPIEYFTDFPFIPNPDGSIYALGFGVLLGPLNESSNTLINQLVDSGTLNNLQAGFIGKGLRLRMGQTSLQPGEFKVVNATGEDLQKSIFIMPTKEPSNVLMALLQMLIQSGNQLASIAEIFVGKMPGQNTPATTTQETVQQGMAVFTAIYKRVYRSLSKEFKKIFWLNKICPDIVEEESKLSGMQLEASDYDLPEWAVIPGADPTGDSTSTRMMKLQQVGQLLQMGTIDPMVYTRMVLDANEIPNAQQLMKQPQPPPPDPKMELLKQKGQQDAETHQMDMQGKQQDVVTKGELAEIKKATLAYKAQHEQQMQALKEQGLKMDQRNSSLMQVIEQQAQHTASILEALKGRAKTQQELQQKEVSHRQDLTHAEQTQRQKLTLAAQKARQEAKKKKPSE